MIPQRILHTDFLIIGSGIAGLRAAVTLGERGTVLMVTKDRFMESSSGFAQGGIAVALGEDDRIEDHLEDTLKAGAGLCNREAVQVLVEEGPNRVRELIAWGAAFDQENGKFLLGREGAHRRRRILHSRDSTGEEIVRTLLGKVSEIPTITRLPLAFTVDLIVDPESGRCLGAVLLDETSRETMAVLARAVILASGGAGQIYARTTNPPGATGDGIAMAYRAGAVLEDMEFVQFHPTALALAGTPPFLITEALRGEGAILRNARGERFMPAQHPMAELAPRDILSRAILKEMEKTGTPHVLLDATHIPAGGIRDHFPTIYEACLKYGIDVTREPVPVSPSAHFFIGGVKTDLRGRTTLPGLFAAGETACTGVHGANRLASNSLLEGLVFGALAGEAAAEHGATFPRPDRLPSLTPDGPASAIPDLDRQRKALQEILWTKAGILRSRTTLEEAASAMAPWAALESARPTTRGELEFRNMLIVAGRVVEGARMREESVGAHYREDFPESTGKVSHYPLRKKGS